MNFSHIRMWCPVFKNPKQTFIYPLSHSNHLLFSTLIPELPYEFPNLHSNLPQSFKWTQNHSNDISVSFITVLQSDSTCPIQFKPPLHCLRLLIQPTRNLYIKIPSSISNHLHPYFELSVKDLTSCKVRNTAIIYWWVINVS